ncbi:MAG: permease [Leucobacter sp.]|nr:permease [Leucobacter sp.]
MSYSSYVLPKEERTSRWSLTMAWWALFSAMFWLYIAVASAGVVGVADTLIGMGLSIVAYGIINAILSNYSARTGLTVELLSRSLFGVIGSALAALILAATAIYYIVFEATMIAVALQIYFGGDIKWWYLVCVVYALPLAMGGVRRWLDRLNGYLLPIYFLGLIAAVVMSLINRGMPAAADWPTGIEGGVLPGWLTVFLIYMGVWIMMMYTFDFARFGRKKDAKFHSTITFGWVFYIMTFLFNGLVGIFLVVAWGVQGTETGVVEAVVSSLGLIGVIVVIASQTRINSASYYMSSTNLDAVFRRLFRVRLPRWVYVVITGAVVYLVMLTDVLTWILKALAWQGVFVTAWVAIALVYIAWANKRPTLLPEVRGSHLPAIAPGAIIWLAVSALGIWLTEQSGAPLLAQLAPLITVVLAGTASYLAIKAVPPRTVKVAEEVKVDVEQLV